MFSTNKIKSNQIKCWFLVRGENRSTRGKTSHSRVENQQTQSTIWRRVQKSNPGHIGGRQVLSQQRQPCHLICFTSSEKSSNVLLAIFFFMYSIALVLTLEISPLAHKITSFHNVNRIDMFFNLTLKCLSNIAWISERKWGKFENSDQKSIPTLVNCSFYQFWLYH